MTRLLATLIRTLAALLIAALFGVHLLNLED